MYHPSKATLNYHNQILSQGAPTSQPQRLPSRMHHTGSQDNLMLSSCELRGWVSGCASLGSLHLRPGSGLLVAFLVPGSFHSCWWPLGPHIYGSLKGDRQKDIISYLPKDRGLQGGRQHGGLGCGGEGGFGAREPGSETWLCHLVAR